MSEEINYSEEQDDPNLGDRKVEDLTERDFDFQGWLIPHINLRRVLEELGFKVDKKKNILYIENNSKLLDVYPSVLEDDGMGYGVNERKVSEVTYDKKVGYVNIFVH